MKVKLYGTALLLTLIFMPAIPRGDAIAPPEKIEIENFEPIKKVEAKKVSKKAKLQTKPVVAATSSGGCALVYNYNWPQATAYRICMCESGGNSNAIGDNYPINGLYAPSVGLMQIRLLSGRPSKAWLLDPKNNMDYAYGMWKSQGFYPWSCY